MTDSPPADKATTGPAAGIRRWNPTPRNIVLPANPGRFSRFVGVIKYGLIAVALAVVVIVVGWPEQFGNKVDIGTPVVEATDEGVNLKMVNARYAGVDGENRPYLITADSAAQDPADTWRVLLDKLQADITLQDGTWLTLSAANGNWHQKRQILNLGGVINMFSDIGYEIEAVDARIDLTLGRAVSANPVTGQGPFGLFQAHNFEIVEFGDVIRFGGGVKMTIFPGWKD
ncbi:MAG: LPS export ABC transporter periplasmic protein LptC [Minwuiales bacterium]|nr:LPS export ABC transporter periplasmic protein LptC [Minwuiales bacterium]